VERVAADEGIVLGLDRRARLMAISTTLASSIAGMALYFWPIYSYLAIAVCFGTVLLFAVRNQPINLLYLSILLIPISQKNVQTNLLGLSLTNILLFGLLLLLIANLLTNKVPWHLNRSSTTLLLLVVIFLIFLGITVPFAFNPSEQIRFVAIMASGMLPLVASIWLVNDLEKVRHVCRMVLLSAVMAAIAASLSSFGIVNLSFLNSEGGRIVDIGALEARSAGFYENYGSYGMLLEAGLSLAVINTLVPGTVFGKRSLSLIFLGILLAGLLASQDRSTFLGVMTTVGVLLFLWFGSQGKRKIRWFFGVGLTILLVFLLWPILNEAWQGFIALKEKTYYGRIDIFELALSFKNKALWFGIGIGGFRGLTGADHIVHNTFLSMFLSGGFIAVTLFSVLIGYALLTGLRLNLTTQDSTLRLLSSAILASLIGMVVEMQAFNGPAIKVLWLLVGLAVVLLRIDGPKSKIQNNNNMNN
jgi:hypothetical protein